MLPRRSHPLSAVPSAAFRGFRFPPEIIVLALRWYLRYDLSYPDDMPMALSLEFRRDVVAVARTGKRVGVITVGALLPYSPVAHDLGFEALPADFFLLLAGMVVLYLFIVELAKQRFFERIPGPEQPARPSETRTCTSHPASRAALFDTGHNHDPPPPAYYSGRMHSRKSDSG